MIGSWLPATLLSACKAKKNVLELFLAANCFTLSSVCDKGKTLVLDEKRFKFKSVRVLLLISLLIARINCTINNLKNFN